MVELDIHNNDVSTKAKENYSNSSPWPENDVWHKYTYINEKKTIELWLEKLARDEMVILNAGSGGTTYKTRGHIIHLDIIEDYVKGFDDHLVGTVERIELSDNSVDGIICVGSVINYADLQRTVFEFSRILKPGGFFILEFERSDSAEFLFKKVHHAHVFCKEYNYNEQNHLLWMYSEKHVRQVLNHYGLKVDKKKRIHCLSTLINRFGLSEQKSAHFCSLDRVMQPLSYSIAHNVLMLGTKQLPPKSHNRNSPSDN